MLECDAEEPGTGLVCTNHSCEGCACHQGGAAVDDRRRQEGGTARCQRHAWPRRRSYRGRSQRVHRMQDAAAAQGGWQADAVSHFLAQRSWAAISAFYASTVTGGVQLSSLGLTLVQPPSAPPPPPVAAPPLPSSVASQGAEQAASVQRSQQTAADANRVGVQTASAAAAAAAAAAAPAPQPGGRGQHRQRRTFKLHFAHLGPAFR